MARRYIGDAVVYIQYHDDGDYRGSVVAWENEQWPQFKKRMVWKFDELRPPAIGFDFAYDGPEAYDEMAQSAVSFGSYYTTDNRGEDTPEIADAINNAVSWASNDDGTYEVRRRK